ncbi:putative P-loop containing nucleoside triphosphate hydrolase, leucine-rich repeat domain, L [Medicago truncatula]|uniref:Putative P-loop containing nucleoside triphosphate hydrolase, leucine-rich repeat domain, L n=1 Tax=Medicago truncatula TaxID=3880 RepID=A0A396HPH7_MEDTR|nr:putative P-loop containing nucleoside triphosphate hydrolase, leucine-rich repeat domain, L [Medicago truncatula]
MLRCVVLEVENKGIKELGESSARSARVDESSIYGRDDDRKKLKHLLLSTGFDNSKVGIISIVGMGGIGKTSLAKLLYYDPEVREKFELKLWANISNAFEHVNDFSVFETILESIASKKISDDNLNRQKTDTSDAKIIYPKVLLVLDDARDAEIVNRIYQMDIFIAGEMGSRIIVTTRNEKVAMSMKYSLYVHYLRPLESEDCWSLIARHAFGPCNYQERTNLEEIGREIAKKCGGLPYIALALGTLLRSKISPDYWNYVLETNIWELTDSEVQEALRLSLHYLLLPLKECFAYCSNFPKNSILEKKTIIQLWIAEGLVESSTSQECWEKVGEEYFDLLVSRLLIQLRSIDDEEANFEINNFMHDLGTTVSSQYDLWTLKHNFSYTRGDYDSLNKFDKLHELKGLRTFLALPFQEQSPLCLLSNKVIHAMLPRMKKLRVLSLSNYRSITEVPNSIGSLIYLRYLNLSHTQIERLPSKTCKLYNLQFLLLSGCKRLTELPEDMGKLVNLLHLNISDTALREMPEQIAKLQNLQSLSDFVVSSGLKIAELGKFPQLHGKLAISQLQNVNDPLEASLANMMMKERIDELALEWDCGSNFSDSKIQSVVLENLRPSTNLKSLTIKGYGGISFPNWLGDILFSNMMSLRISNCDACLWLPPLGQLGNLKELIIKGMQSIQTIGTEFYGSDRSSFQPFPSLVTLHFEDMEEWEEWDLNGENVLYWCNQCHH